MYKPESVEDQVYVLRSRVEALEAEQRNRANEHESTDIFLSILQMQINNLRQKNIELEKRLSDIDGVSE